jgi:hypothetical protein
MPDATPYLLRQPDCVSGFLEIIGCVHSISGEAGVMAGSSPPGNLNRAAGDMRRRSGE